jgi:hypothetical protein
MKSPRFTFCRLNHGIDAFANSVGKTIIKIGGEWPKISKNLYHIRAANN